MAVWYALTGQQALEELAGDIEGLSHEEAAKRLAGSGPNALPEEEPHPLSQVFFRQFQSPLIYVLLAASAIVFALGEVVDGSIILFVLIFNAVVGTIQEGRAEHTLRALRKFVETNATVLREGSEHIIPDREVVPGDVLILHEGEKVPADARVMLSQNLTVDEASLTGESEPVHKVVEAIVGTDLPSLEQRNMVFKGTAIMAGVGQAVVVATGVTTVIGSIAKEISSVDTEAPLQADIRALSRAIIVVVAVISVALFSVGIATGHGAVEMFTTVVSLAVSVIPEGLPIVMTLVLASGVWRMSKRHALVKRLQAVEALGQARVIAVDKTGTITKNELVVRKAWVAGELFDVAGVGYEPVGALTLRSAAIEAAQHPALLSLGRAAALSASARLSYSEGEKRWRIAGDPTEAAMLVFGEKLGFHKDDVIRESALLGEIPFDYKLTYHATVHKDGAGTLLIVTGAPEAVLTLCRSVLRSGERAPLGTREREELEAIVSDMSLGGLRVLAVASASGVAEGVRPETIGALTFLGFFGMQDALRSEVTPAMRRARGAGIRVVMITGDHVKTATAIAREAGIYAEGDEVLTGADIDALPDAELAERLARVSVFARVTPEHKLRIITGYRGRGEIVAMTGDGVNDAPSLVAADLGVAMGTIGTEVAKEAADIVLLDDDFGSIVSAIEEGRSIFKTIKKVILYLFSTSAGEVLVIAGALALGYPLPLLAAQIIWLNFVTDGFLDVALAMEPKETGLLAERFERPRRYLIDARMVERMVVMALPMMVGTLYVFGQYFETDMTKAWTIALTTLAVFQWFNAWNCRSETRSLFAMNPFSNPFLIGATAITVGLQMFAVYSPLMNTFLHTTPLTLAEWFVILPIAASVVLFEEVRKFLRRRSLAPARLVANPSTP
jgi:Ca2+-transporting ATPase